MKPLCCDFCNGNLVMDDSREFAVCEFCGTKYLKSTLQSKIQEITGTVTVSGTVRTMETDFVIRGGVLEKYNGSNVNVIIPNSVVIIGDYVFQGLAIRSVVIPNSVERIGRCAFEGTQLEKVDIPESVREIGNAAFSNCPQLKEVNLPRTIKLMYEAFSSGNLLTITNAEYYRVEDFCGSEWFKQNCSRIWASQGRCPICGGAYRKGLIFKKCVRCEDLAI